MQKINSRHKGNERWLMHSHHLTYTNKVFFLSLALFGLLQLYWLSAANTNTSAQLAGASAPLWAPLGVSLTEVVRAPALAFCSATDCPGADDLLTHYFSLSDDFGRILPHGKEKTWLIKEMNCWWKYDVGLKWMEIMNLLFKHDSALQTNRMIWLGKVKDVEILYWKKRKHFGL